MKKKSNFIRLIVLAPVGLLVGHGAVIERAGANDSEFEKMAGKATLRIEVAQNRSFVLTGVGQSCAVTRIIPGRISYPQVKMSWDGSGPLTDVGVVLAFNHPSIEGGRFVCEIEQGEFDAMFGVMGALIGAGSTLRNLSQCPVQCGGLKTVARAAAFRATGTLTVVGLASQGSAQIPYQTSVPIEFDFVP